MIVYCPGCGAKIDALPAEGNNSVQCPRCQSTFTIEGIKAPAAEAAPKQPLRKKKKKGGGKLVGALIVLLVLGLLGGGTAAVLYYTGVIGPFSWSRVSGTATPLNWQEFVSDEGKFRVQLPGVPSRSVRSAGRGGPRDIAFVVDLPEVEFSVFYADLDQPALRNMTPEQIISSQREGFTYGRTGRLISEKSVSLGSYKGTEFVIEQTNFQQAHMRTYVAGRRMYSVVARGKARAPTSDEVAKLFDSFEITER